MPPASIVEISWNLRYSYLVTNVSGEMENRNKKHAKKLSLMRDDVAGVILFRHR